MTGVLQLGCQSAEWQDVAVSAHDQDADVELGQDEVQFERLVALLDGILGAVNGGRSSEVEEALLVIVVESSEEGRSPSNIKGCGWLKSRVIGHAQVSRCFGLLRIRRWKALCAVAAEVIVGLHHLALDLSVHQWMGVP